MIEKDFPGAADLIKELDEESNDCDLFKDMNDHICSSKTNISGNLSHPVFKDMNDLVSSSKTNNSGVLSHPVVCSTCKVNAVQSELEKFMKLQDSGLDMSYKCLTCRDCKPCKRGAGQERISMKKEFEQQGIKSSVRIDEDLKQAISFLAFIDDPEEKLVDNQYIALRRLNDVCRKYGN